MATICILPASDGAHLMNDITDTVHDATKYELRILFPAILPLFVVHTNVMFKNHITIVV